MEKETFVLRFNDLTEDAQKRFTEYTGTLGPAIMEDPERPVAMYFGKPTNLDVPTVAMYIDPSAR